MTTGWTCPDLAAALARRAAFVTGVPGSPITHILEALVDAGRAELAVNEKVAVEEALGATYRNLPSVVIMKHNGLGCALDSLANAAVHTTGAALVVVVGDDPDCRSSTACLDSRVLARVCGVPVLEPDLAGPVEEAVERAFSASARLHLPIILRVTPALHDGCAGATAGDLPVAGVPATAIVTRDRVAHELTKLGRVQHHASVIGAGAPIIGPTATCDAGAGRAVVVVGAAARVVDPDPGACVHPVEAPWPLPEDAVEALRCHDDILVVEDGTPFVEGQLRLALGTAVRGRLTGHLPRVGTATRRQVAEALRGPAAHQAVPRPDEKGDADVVCAPWDALFRAVARLRREGTFVATDVGSAVGLCYPPYRGADVALALGAAPAVAAGAARGGVPALAVTGDYAVTHSALQALLAVAERRTPVTTVVLLNGRQAKTGGQALALPRWKESLGLLGLPVTDLGDVSEADAYAHLACSLESAPAIVLARPHA